MRPKRKYFVSLGYLKVSMNVGFLNADEEIKVRRDNCINRIGRFDDPFAQIRRASHLSQSRSISRVKCWAS